MQALPDGSTKSFSSMGLVWELATAIADFRAGNGLERATPKEALADIETYSCARLHDDLNWCVKKKATGVRAAIDRLSANVRVAGTGARILVEWLGEGAKPVPIKLAQARAEVCATCPENREGHAFLKLTAETVRAIADQMREKEAMKLRVEGEERLASCRVCLCPLQLKVHVPLATILAHTDTKTLRAFPPACWIPTEQQSL